MFGKGGEREGRWHSTRDGKGGEEKKDEGKGEKR